MTGKTALAEKLSSFSVIFPAEVRLRQPEKEVSVYVSLVTVTPGNSFRNISSRASSFMCLAFTVMLT